ncbi:effector-associated constant component EACC1, partial [Streptomyces sp. NRRL WC-3549]|uniref:effector-associated constant component EACC1 n=1 Tax=Streptomyces sp. NRRL WC-3549 TaxID=1463925 RepID=UPI003B64009B
MSIPKSPREQRFPANVGGSVARRRRERGDRACALRVGRGRHAARVAEELRMNVGVAITGAGAADELRSLHEWLTVEEELRGRVR